MSIGPHRTGARAPGRWGESGRPVYGIQFHAECYDDAHPDGRRVLQNFFRIAAERAKAGG